MSTERLDLKPFPVIRGVSVQLLVVLGCLIPFAGSVAYDFYTAMWSKSGQDYGPLVLCFAGWHLFVTSKQWVQPTDKSSGALGYCGLVAAALILFVSRWLSILALEVVAMQIALVGAIYLVGSEKSLKASWFSIFFLCFLIPLPGPVVDFLTQPMKQAISAAVVFLLDGLGLPVARSGVVIYVAQYRLLVADACAGLTTLFTLEAFGLLYINLTKSASAARNITLGLLVVPISFLANAVRVLVLCLVTLYFGDEAGQGFIHNFSGIVLFSVALVFLIAFDAVCRRLIGWK